ncbi:MAG: hypothetical protein ACYS3N_08685 [Planctomycetota bacterium]|jgi:hypothetical protein
MLKALEKKLRVVRFRCSVNLFLKYLERVLTAGGIFAVLAVLTERLLALSVINYRSIWIFWGVAAVLVLLLWLFGRPRRMQLSLLLDERLKLHERFSTTLALSDSKDHFAAAARREARETVRRINLQGHFPIRPSKCGIYAASTWLIVAALILYMPQKDLLGFLRKQRQQEEHAQQAQQAKVEIKQAASPVKLAVKQLGEPELADALSKLEQMPEDAMPQDIKRQAIRKLGSLSDTIKKMQSDMQLDSVNLMQRMFKQLRGSPDVLSQKLRLALAKGNFADASNLLNQLRKELAEGKLSQQQQKDLSKQLQNLAKQLQELAQKNEELEKELEKLGLSKKLAKLSDKQLRQSLQKQGLSAEKIEELLRKAAAFRSASSRCSGLGSAMASCGAGAGGLSGDELAAVMEQLDEFESIKQQLMLTEASLAEISRAIGCLGEGMWDGRGLQGPFMEGLSDKYGPGTGGPGMGYGPRSIDEMGETSTKKTRLKNEPGQGPVIASWYFKASQVKGQAMRDYSEVVQEGRDSAAEAISDNLIPRKYEESIKKYFGQLEQSGGE